MSVILSTYQGEDFLRESLDSVLTQTLEDVELIVVDDSSTDTTPAILAEYHDPRMRVLRNAENAGVSRSVNRGLEAARGWYVARQDDDDVSEPDRLEKQVAYLERHAEVGLVASSYTVIDAHGKVLRRRTTPTESLALRWRLLFINAFASSSVLFRRELVDRVGAFRDGFPFAQDYDLWSRIAGETDVAALPEALVRYRHAGPSVTSTIGASADDVDRISRENMRRLGPAAQALAEKIDRETAWRLLFANGYGLTAKQARPVVRDILALQRIFAQKQCLGRDERLNHLLGVTRSIGTSFLHMAKSHMRNR